MSFPFDARPFLRIACLMTLSTLSAQDTSPIPLWPDGAPGALGTADKDVPTITPFPAKGEATGAAMLILPGGGYGMLADHEGKGYADWLSAHGIACFVLKYRLGSAGYRHPIMWQDASRAMRLLRARAEAWKIDPKRIGIMGSSAGGHLASTVLTHFDAGQSDDVDPVERQGSRPDLGILCYPVISMGPIGHAGSRKNLLGEAPDPSLVTFLSSELQVTSNTPPCFLWHTWEDKGVKVENTLVFATALRKNGVPFDLHIYQKGGHGMGLGKNHPWPEDCLYWLKAQGFLTAKDGPK